MRTAVVLLDECLKLSASSPTLDALLLRLFTSLLDTTDQKRFVEFMERSDNVAKSLHVTFRGGGGPGLRAQLHHKRFEDVGGRTRHLVGIVEESVPRPAASMLSRASLSAITAVRPSEGDFVSIRAADWEN